MDSVHEFAGVRMEQLVEQEQVARVRAFNRRWTEILGLLDRGLLETDRSLAEARVLYELVERPSWERVELRDRLGMDASFLTRVLARLQSAGLVRAERSPDDRRRRRVALTPAGRAAAVDLDERSAAQVSDLLTSLPQLLRRALVDALVTAGHVVAADAPSTVVVRDLGPGDLGWMVQRHGEVYAAEYGWDETFEALVARIVADFRDGFQHGVEHGWIAEVDGARAGCVLCCRRDDQTAQLRILLVEPWARGLGLGRRLVDECVAFAVRAGYRSMVLWTNDVLVAARRIYEAAGFALVDEEPHHSFGHDLVGQTWRLELGGP